jgi:hypothetical protein
MNPKIQRYHDLYNKLYIGFLSIEDGKKLLKLEDDYKPTQRVMVAVEKKHSEEIILTYYIQLTRKKLYLYSFDDDNNVVKEKKDPYGITVTEVFHIDKMMDDSYRLHLGYINTIKKLLNKIEA